MGSFPKSSAVADDAEAHVFTVGHEAFWEALASDDLAPDARVEIETGLYLLRHFEFVYQPRIAGSQDAEFRLKHQVRNVTDKTTRQVLSDVLMSMWQGTDVAVPLAVVNYGLFLQKRGQWALAHAVWDSALFAWKAAHEEQSRACIEGRLNRAMAARYLARYEDALRDYVIAQTAAAQAGYQMLQLQAVIGGSAAIADNGSPRLGLMMIQDAARIARLMGATHHEVVARITCGHIYQVGKKPDQALLEFSLAYELAETTEDTEQALSNIAACAAEYGYWDLASDTNELVAATSQSPYLRSYALCNLVELSSWMKNSQAFERACEGLQDIELDAQVKAFATLYKLRGMYTFSATSDLQAAYAEGAETIHRLGVQTAYDEIQADRTALASGQPIGQPVIAEKPLPLALKRLHQLLRSRLKQAVA